MLNLVRKVFFINYLCVIEVFREKWVLFLRKLWKPLRKKLNNSEKMEKMMNCSFFEKKEKQSAHQVETQF